MKRYLLLLVFLTGCASAPPNPWEGLETETGPATMSLDCGQFPLPSESSESIIVYDITGVNALEAYRLCSEANAANVDNHAAQIGQLKVVRKGLTEAGQAQRRISDMKTEILQEERKHHFFEKIGLYVIIAVGAFAL